MRILMTADAAGGVGVFADELAAALLVRGHHVLVAVFSPTRPAFTPGLHRLWVPFRLEWMDECGRADGVAADAQAGRAFLVDLARHWRPDVLHTNHFAFSSALPRTPSVLTVHSDVVSWWRTVRGTLPPENAFQRWYAILARQALNCASAVVTPSQAARRDLIASFAPHVPIQVIANGRDPKHFASAPKHALAMTAGRVWDEGKQMHLLGAVTPPRPLELVVAGQRRAPLQAELSPTPPGTRWLGHLPPAELHQWMARACAYVGTSLYEPFGLTVLEAAFSGCALLLNDIASWRELWAPAAAFYSTTEQLQSLLRHIASNRDWAQQQGQLARRHARRRFTAARMAQAYESVYQRVRLAAAA